MIMDQESIEPSRAQPTPEDPIAEPPRYDRADASAEVKEALATPAVDAPQPAWQPTAAVAELPQSQWQGGQWQPGQWQPGQWQAGQEPTAGPLADLPQSQWQPAG